MGYYQALEYLGQHDKEMADLVEYLVQSKLSNISHMTQQIRDITVLICDEIN